MKKKTNFREFIPIGVTLIATGIVFISAVNKEIGMALGVVGIVYLSIGIRKTRKTRKFF